MKTMNMPALMLLSLILIVAYENDAWADSTFRCQGHIISLGDTQTIVLDKCGEPDQKEEWTEEGPNLIFQYYDYEHERYILPKMIHGPLQMTRWTYDLGSNKFIRHLLFQNGELVKIDSGQKGSQRRLPSVRR